MDSYDERLLQLQKEAMEKLQWELKNYIPPKDHLVRANKSYFIQSLIRARHVKHLTQAQLANELGMRQSMISRIESGKGNPSLRTILLIARTLEVDLVLE